VLEEKPKPGALKSKAAAPSDPTGKPRVNIRIRYNPHIIQSQSIGALPIWNSSGSRYAAR
jgi:hypothetical protein